MKSWAKLKIQIELLIIHSKSRDFWLGLSVFMELSINILQALQQIMGKQLCSTNHEKDMANINL